MTVDNTALAILFLVAIVGREIVVLAIRKVWTRTIDTEYMTREACAICRDHCLSDRRIKDDDLIDLVKSLRDEVKELRMQIVRHMLYSKAPVEAIEAAIGTKIGGTR
jgi:hypothetical protein